MSPQLLTSMIQTCANGDALLELVDQYGPSFNFIHASCALHTAARLYIASVSVPPRVVAQLVEVARRHTQQMQARAVANTAWALAKLGHVDAEFNRALVQAARPQLHSFNPQDLANTAWALATMGHEEATFMGALVRAALNQLRNFNPQNLAFPLSLQVSSLTDCARRGQTNLTRESVNHHHDTSHTRDQVARLGLDVRAKKTAQKPTNKARPSRPAPL
jgi:hypothetical protein